MELVACKRELKWFRMNLSLALAVSSAWNTLLQMVTWWLLHSFQVLAQMIPYWGGLPWPPNRRATPACSCISDVSCHGLFFPHCIYYSLTFINLLVYCVCIYIPPNTLIFMCSTATLRPKIMLFTVCLDFWESEGLCVVQCCLPSAYISVWHLVTYCWIK